MHEIQRLRYLLDADWVEIQTYLRPGGTLQLAMLIELEATPVSTLLRCSAVCQFVRQDLEMWIKRLQ